MSGDPERREAMAEEVKGRAEEALGAITGRDDLREEGQTRQERADKLREAEEKERAAARLQAEADQARAEADRAGADQRPDRP